MDGQTKEQNRNSDIRDVEEHARLPARAVYEVVRQEGLEHGPAVDFVMVVAIRGWAVHYFRWFHRWS
jgi:hypothetical protein